MDNQLPNGSPVPPVIVTPAPAWSRPVRPRKPYGWMVLSLVLAVLLFWSLFGHVPRFFNFSSVAKQTGRQTGRQLHELVVENNGSQNRIAIVDVAGLITSEAWDRSGRSMVDFIADQFEMAARDDSIKAVVLKVDSPGGEVMASDDIARSISDFEKETGKPVVASMGSLAASGGYYVSVPCEWIVANELTITGSIGVIIQTFNYRGLLDKVGVFPLVFKSGKFKDMLRGSKKPDEMLPEAEKMIQDMVNETYGKFKDVVRDGRGKSYKKNKGEGKALAKDWEQYADGRIFTGKQALDLGFVDEIGNFNTAVDRAKNLAGIADANLIRYQEAFDFSRLFGLLGSSDSSTKVKIDLGLDLPKLKAGRPYFLSETVIH